MSDALNMFRESKSTIPEIRFVLPGSGTELLMRPFTTKEQKAILKAMEKEDHDLINASFDALIAKCVLNPGFDPDTLYSKDRDALLIKLREESVSDEYVHNYECSNEDCKAKNEQSVLIHQLDFKKLEKQSFSTEIQLEDRNCKLVLGMVTRGDEKQMMKSVRKNSKDMKDGISRTELMNGAFAACIKGILMPSEGEIEGKKVLSLSFDDKMAMLEEMSFKDKKKIQDFMASIEKFGFDMSIDCKCSKCGNSQTVEVEWLSFFIV